jgi:hypothetical protein
LKKRTGGYLDGEIDVDLKEKVHVCPFNSCQKFDFGHQTPKLVIFGHPTIQI